jgi:hypothetical protein
LFFWSAWQFLISGRIEDHCEVCIVLGCSDPEMGESVNCPSCQAFWGSAWNDKFLQLLQQSTGPRIMQIIILNPDAFSIRFMAVSASSHFIAVYTLVTCHDRPFAPLNTPSDTSVFSASSAHPHRIWETCLGATCRLTWPLNSRFPVVSLPLMCWFFRDCSVRPWTLTNRPVWWSLPFFQNQIVCLI